LGGIVKTEGTEELNAELKSELIRALFVLRNMHLHHFGQRRFGAGGAAIRRGVMREGFDMNMPAFALMKQLRLREEKGETGVAWLSEMSEYLHVSKAAVSQMLGTLEGRGLITREIDPSNRRTIIVKLTEKGGEMIDRFERGFDSYIGVLIDRFGENDTREIIRLIYKFTYIIDEVQKDLNIEAIE